MVIVGSINHQSFLIHFVTWKQLGDRPILYSFSKHLRERVFLFYVIFPLEIAVGKYKSIYCWISELHVKKGIRTSINDFTT